MRARFGVAVLFMLTVFLLPALGQAPPQQQGPSAKPPASPGSAPAAPAAPVPPLTTQVKKTVVYLRSDCLHNFTDDLSSLNRDRLAAMPLPQEISVVQKLVDVTSKMQAVRASMSKLSAEEAAYIRNPNALTNDPAQLATEGEWRASILLKMTALTPADVQDMTPAELDALPADKNFGTGFLIVVPDARLKIPAGFDAETFGFTYLVTNRHVVQPGIDVGKPCEVPLSSFVILNHKPDSAHPSIYAQTILVDKGVKWHFSTDDTVDLAVVLAPIPTEEYDFTRIPIAQFLTLDDMHNRKAVEGDPLLFSGLFIQLFDLDKEIKSLEPIVRSGSLAMVPEGLLPTTMQRKPGHILLADAHVFHGNSGSPVFVDTARFESGYGYSYKFLGVICGEVYENADLTFTVTASISATVGANSDVSIIVPAWQILDILDLPELKKERDDLIAAHPEMTNTDASAPKP
jgi:hypothetical protein